MNNEELVTKMKAVRSNLQNAAAQLSYAKEELKKVITFNNDGFKTEELSSLNSKINTQVSNINNKIIPKINNM